MWNNHTDHRNPSVAGDCSWEARAFVEDKGSATWPPRSYTCSFCMREFRSAQALGGHMNVHRRDRAQLRQSEPSHAAAAAAPQRPMVFSSSEFVASGAGMIFYSNISNQAVPMFLSASTDSTYQTDIVNFPMASSLLDKVGMYRDNDNNIGTDHSSADDTFVTELDLELRLGW